MDRNSYRMKQIITCGYEESIRNHILFFGTIEIESDIKNDSKAFIILKVDGQ